MTYVDYAVHDMTVRYLQNDMGHVGLLLFPAALRSRLATRRTSLRGEPFIDCMPDEGAMPAIEIDSLVQVKMTGEEYTGAFAQGRTMRGAPGNKDFILVDQQMTRSEDFTVILTTLERGDGCRLEHHLRWRAGDAAVEIFTRFHNRSSTPLTLELLTSFSLGGLTPFDIADATGRLKVHRFRSVWSAEGRLDTQSIEKLHLERSWSGAGLFSERFGQVGSMPVRGWFPFVALEDTEAGVTWAANLAWAGSWQMEVSRQHDDVCLSGGLADREFGHWTKTLAPGETLTSPSATLTCVAGGLDEACDRLTAVQKYAITTQPAIEADLPVIFNEWCTTWGDPRHDKVLTIADRIKDSGVTYLVIDAGWYKAQGSDWGRGHGDWVPSPVLFPDGLSAIAAAIRERGLIPGLWFEMETVGSQSRAFQDTDLLLHRDGRPMTVRDRRFWDLNNSAAVANLDENVIARLAEGGFDYLKVDYNETIGIGSDHPDGQGEGLRRQIEGVYRLFDRIRQKLPDLVIENCSSGGHRLEPSMLARTAMSSFSDAHELVEIPIIAANLHRLMLPRQSQIWAVLHAADGDRRLVYSLAATFLGRMCLSGDVVGLNDSQWRLVRRAIDVYRAAAPILKDGVSRRFGDLGESWRHPCGWQAVVRRAAGGDRMLVVLHAFATAPEIISVPLGETGWEIELQFNAMDSLLLVDGPELSARLNGDFAGCVVILRRNRKDG